ncbi:hypothetical protein R1sor_027077 [Riccia sorocarpa]|uniref:Uncharacterized protein n=1 Tax=Riccia sorocarpa TaxID=122646 RepID=A0ABD3GFB9_9MARC
MHIAMGSMNADRYPPSQDWGSNSSTTFGLARHCHNCGFTNQNWTAIIFFSLTVVATVAFIPFHKFVSIRMRKIEAEMERVEQEHSEFVRAVAELEYEFTTFTQRRATLSSPQLTQDFMVFETPSGRLLLGTVKMHDSDKPSTSRAREEEIDSDTDPDTEGFRPVNRGPGIRIGDTDTAVSLFDVRDLLCKIRLLR